MGAILKLTVKNVVDFWFAEDTPIRQYKVRMNPKLWDMCQQISLDFKAPSGAQEPKQYRKSDKVAFAKIVLTALGGAEIGEHAESEEFDMAY